MSQELGYVLITPYSLMKSRTGGIISRLFARTQLELVGARMFAPTKKMVDEFGASIREVITDKKEKVKVRELFTRYLYDNCIPKKGGGSRPRLMCLLFKGEKAVQRLKEVVGSIRGTIAGETIRETYGDYIKDFEGAVKYFEPAVFIGVSSSETKKQLKILARYSDSDGGLLEDVVDYGSKKNIEKTLVLIKPDNFRFPSGRAGNIIDSFSRTGLFIIGAKVLQMSVSQAEEFYDPVKEILREKLKPKLKNDIKQALEKTLFLSMPESLLDHMTEELKELNMEKNFHEIIQFMTGYDLSLPLSKKERSAPGKVKCLALVYQGPDAIRKIREQLGSTDPSKAAPATVRKEFGQNVMENTAHASDSYENALREMKIVKIDDNEFKQVIKEHVI
ncbi:MAG: nucleoside-diphosphate kinase [Candidatus Aureabacteria bacterium]|nr:nucleoside-diphosphate kinase [Candidatus Auribacterota bacterium]